MVVEEQNGNSSSILRMNYVRIPELFEPDTHLRGDVAQAPNLESGNGPQILGNILESELPSSGAPLPLGLRSDQDLDLSLPTHPNTSDLSHIIQEPQETVHHFWARFLLVMSKVKDCHEEDAISLFCKNCTDKGILNAISRRDIAHFADLAAIVQKYCVRKAPGRPKQHSGILRP